MPSTQEALGSTVLQIHAAASQPAVNKSPGEVLRSLRLRPWGTLVAKARASWVPGPESDEMCKGQAMGTSGSQGQSSCPGAFTCHLQVRAEMYGRACRIACKVYVLQACLKLCVPQDPPHPVKPSAYGHDNSHPGFHGAWGPRHPSESRASVTALVRRIGAGQGAGEGQILLPLV